MGIVTEVSDAIISPDGVYRYKLSRYWTQKLAPAVWIMLNPSTADAVQNDATIRRCISFARRWGFGGIEVYNLFALRSRHPISIGTADDPIGPENDKWLETAVQSGRTVIAAWGRCETTLQSQRATQMIELLHRSQVGCAVCLGFTKTGHPRHPLFVPNDTLPCALPCSS